jgi:Tfp pilus assembly protein PilX
MAPMLGKQDGRSTPPGIYERSRTAQITSIEVIAIALSLLWLLGCGLFFMLAPAGDAPDTGGALRFMMTVLAIFLPVAMIWVAATAARASRVMREESQRLQAAIDAIRQAYVAQAQGRGVNQEPSVARKLDEIAAATRKTETALAKFTSSRPQNAPLRPKPDPAIANGADDQAALPLGTPAEEMFPPLSREDFIRALNFPETAQDEVGFAALRKALRDRQAAQLVQASQDVLTLLSQDGIYMDDLRPDMARPEIWRRFAGGERGRVVAALGGIRDRSSLALTAGRMKQDPIFRDAAHHFLRRFDKMFAEFEKDASDAEISDLSNTRTARAFMLLGRVAGIFD